MAKKSTNKLVRSSIEAEPMVAFWRRDLTADFKGLLTALGKAVANGLAGKNDEIVADFAEAAVAIGIDTPPEQLAWRLAKKSLLRSVMVIVTDARDMFAILEISEEKAKIVADRVDYAMEQVPIVVDRQFFERPGEMPIIHWVQNSLNQWLNNLGLDASKADGIASRLPSYFTFAVHNEWRTHREAYKPLSTFLDTPFAAASDREQQWSLYTAWLNQQADQRMFDEGFSVRSVYVKLRVSFDKKKLKDRSGLRLESGEHNRKQQVAWLDDCLQAWIEEWRREDAIRILSGGPGSGKSAFARLLAANVSTSGKCKVIYVPLHLFELTADLVAAVHVFCNENPYLPKEVLDAKSGEKQVLLIFDGLDELEKQGKMAAQVAADFVAEVSRVVDRINQTTTRVLVLICGRPVAVQAGETVLRREEQILHLLPYSMVEDERRQYIDPLNILDTDQRDEWWEKYGKCVGRNYSKLPIELARDDFLEITAQPLLNYLVALSFDRGKLNFGKSVNLNVVYRDLIEAVHERGYERRVNRSIEGLDLEKFVRVLEEIGLAAWHGDGRTTTVKKIESRCQKTNLVSQALIQFAGDAKAGVTRLLTAFYFRQHGEVDGDKTFEFTHKSFGEYLAACRLVREIVLIDQKLRNRDFGDEGGFDELQSLERWADICGPKEMTYDLHRFLRQQVATISKEDARRLQTSCIRLINHLLRQGMPMEKLSEISTFKESDRQARNAEESLLATLNACAEYTKIRSDIDWPEPTSFGSWLSRLSPQRKGPVNRVAFNSLSYLSSVKQYVPLRDFYGADLRCSHLGSLKGELVNFISANLQEANLRRADLKGADFSRANLVRANFGRADLIKANFESANLYGAIFKDAKLMQAVFEGCNLENADFQRADLAGVNFQQSTLQGANLVEALLRNAELQSANLIRANLQQSSLAEANLDGAILKGANLKDADLEDANFERADLSGADFSGANLERVNFRYANLKGAKFIKTTIKKVDLRFAENVPPVLVNFSTE